MYEVGVIARFEAAHALRGEFGSASRKHGHTYRVEAVVSGPKLRADGTLFDLTLLRSSLDAVLAELDYQDLDTLPAFQGRNSTAEGVAGYLWERVAPALRREGLASLAIRVWENELAFAGHSAPLI